MGFREYSTGGLERVCTDPGGREHMERVVSRGSVLRSFKSGEGWEGSCSQELFLLDLVDPAGS